MKVNALQMKDRVKRDKMICSGLGHMPSAQSLANMHMLHSKASDQRDNDKQKQTHFNTENPHSFISDEYSNSDTESNPDAIPYTNNCYSPVTPVSDESFDDDQSSHEIGDGNFVFYINTFIFVFIYVIISIFWK